MWHNMCLVPEWYHTLTMFAVGFMILGAMFGTWGWALEKWLPRKDQK